MFKKNKTTKFKGNKYMIKLLNERKGLTNNVEKNNNVKHTSNKKINITQYKDYNSFNKKDCTSNKNSISKVDKKECVSEKDFTNEKKCISKKDNSEYMVLTKSNIDNKIKYNYKFSRVNIYYKIQKELYSFNHILSSIMRNNVFDGDSDELISLYTNLAKIINKYESIRIDSYIDSLSDLQKTVEELSCNASVPIYVDKLNRNISHLLRFLVNLGCKVYRPKRYEKFDSNTMYALNIDEFDLNDELVVEKVISNGYIFGQNNKQTRILPRVWLTKKE